ncbi:MAG: polymerase, sigma-24 subunit, subfamily [Bryobacterales bacterium]|jgi:RNA polymerase sigma-70 factor (ECF subfamily)|nr:polymerase, sigma-24 subunit, subfamily [Bryobacterales bacterium]
MADTTVGFQFECATETFSASAAHEEDSALVAGLRAGDECAYEILIQRFEQPVYNLVSRLIDTPADAADVAQEVFLKVFRKVSGFRSESSLKTWIYRIAVNEARNQHRWFVRHRGKEIGLEPAESDTQGPQDWLSEPGRSPYQTALDQETHELIEWALLKVSPNYRAAVVLREVEGLSYEEISEVLEISLGTVKSRILRGRESLRKHLVDRLRATPQVEWPFELGTQRGDAV